MAGAGGADGACGMLGAPGAGGADGACGMPGAPGSFGAVGSFGMPGSFGAGYVYDLPSTSCPAIIRLPRSVTLSGALGGVTDGIFPDGAAGIPGAGVIGNT